MRGMGLKAFNLTDEDLNDLCGRSPVPGPDRRYGDRPLAMQQRQPRCGAGIARAARGHGEGDGVGRRERHHARQCAPISAFWQAYTDLVTPIYNNATVPVAPAEDDSDAPKKSRPQSVRLPQVTELQLAAQRIAGLGPAENTGSGPARLAASLSNSHVFPGRTRREVALHHAGSPSRYAITGSGDDRMSRRKKHVTSLSAVDIQRNLAALAYIEAERLQRTHQQNKEQGTAAKAEQSR